MRKRSSIPDEDELASLIAQAVASEETPLTADGKNPFAVALGRRGGLKGGKARAVKLSVERRREIAQQGAKARWQNKGKQHSEG